MQFYPDDDSIAKIVNLPISSFIDITSYLEIILSGEKPLFQERIFYPPLPFGESAGEGGTSGRA